MLNLVNKALPALQPLASLITGSGKRARLSILIYHRVLPERDPLLDDEIHAAAFDQQMAALAACFNVMPLSEAVDRLRAEDLPARAACVTFDDGYADNTKVALPILQRLGIRATFFISSGYLNGHCMWNDVVIESLRNTPEPELDLTHLGLDNYPVKTMEERRKAVTLLLRKLKYLPPEQRSGRIEEFLQAASVSPPSGLMMRPDDVKLLSDSGMEIGGHTVSHPILTSLEATPARSEIADGRDQLEEIIKSKVTLFAYPNGKPGQDYRREHVRIVKELGFQAAVSTAWGAATSTSDMHQLPRFTPWDQTPARFVLRLLHNAARRNVETAR